MARKVRQIRRKGKNIGIVPVPATSAPDWSTRIALIQALIPVALEKVEEELKADVARLAGERYVREGHLPGHVRWTRQRGSIYLGDQKIPIEVPRVRDRLRNQEVPLPTYERLQDPIIEALHRVREDIGKAQDFDFRRIAAAIRQPEDENPEGVVRESPKRTTRQRNVS